METQSAQQSSVDEAKTPDVANVQETIPVQNVIDEDDADNQISHVEPTPTVDVQKEVAIDGQPDSSLITPPAATEVPAIIESKPVESHVTVVPAPEAEPTSESVPEPNMAKVSSIVENSNVEHKLVSPDNQSVQNPPSITVSHNQNIVDQAKQPILHSEQVPVLTGYQEEVKAPATVYQTENLAPLMGELPRGDEYLGPSEHELPDVHNLKLFVGGLYYQDENDIFQYFSKFGEIVNSQLMRHKQTGRSRGFAFVTLRDPDGSVKKAVMSRRNEIKGQYVDIKLAEDGKTREKIEMNSAKVFVGGIEGTVSTEELKDFFQNYGAVKEAVVLKNINTNVSRGFGFVTFEDKDLAEIIVRDNNCILKGKRMDVKWAEPKDSTSQKPYQPSYESRGGGGYRSNYRDDYSRMPYQPPVEPPIAIMSPYAPPPSYQPSAPPMRMGHQSRGGYQSGHNSGGYQQNQYYQQPVTQPYKQSYQQPKSHSYSQPNSYQMPSNNYYMPQKEQKYSSQGYQNSGYQGSGGYQSNSGYQNTGGYQDYQSNSQHMQSSYRDNNKHRYKPY